MTKRRYKQREIKVTKDDNRKKTGRKTNKTKVKGREKRKKRISEIDPLI